MVDYDIVPDEQADIEQDRIHQLISISSDGVYLHTKHVSGEAQIEYDIKEAIYTGPLFSGWIYDGAHELEAVRRGLSKTNTSYQCWVSSIKASLVYLSTPKWTTTTINI